jgi:nitroreductase
VNGGPKPVSLLEGLATTRAIRRYTNEPVPDDVLRDIMFAATRAPSGSNRQGFRFIVLRDGPAAAAAKETLRQAALAVWTRKRTADGYDKGSGTRASTPKARMAEVMRGYVEHLDRVPVLILGCLLRFRAPDLIEGGSIYPACQNLLLAARALGYGGVMTSFHREVESELAALLSIPDGVAIAATITLGRPVGRHGPVRRAPLGELVFEDVWDRSATWAVDPDGTRFAKAGPPPYFDKASRI